MLSKTPNKLDMALVDYMPDPDPRRMHATIKVSGQLATISYSEPVAVQGQQQGAPQIPGPMPQNPNPTAVVNPPPGQAVAGGAAQNVQQPNAQPPQRRVIRRRIISGQPGAGP